MTASASQVRRLGFPSIFFLECFLLIGIVGCGLPNYAVVNPPTVQKSPKTDAIGFLTPKNDTNILGYAVFYKIYYDDSDKNEEKDESKWFKPSSSIYSVTEMQPGPTVPNKRGFFRVGLEGESDLSRVSQYLIDNPGPNIPIYIDFDPKKNGLNSGGQPVIGVGPFPLKNTETLARGFIDPRDSSSNKLRSFIGDWRFDEGTKTGFHDGDLRRKGWSTERYDTYDVMQYQPRNIEKVGNPLFGETVSPEIKIGFVVYSFGRDSGGGAFGVIYSIPVYIGTISYQNPQNTNNRGH